MTSKRKIFLRPQAQEDLDSITPSSLSAKEEIFRKMGLLVEFPEMGAAMDKAYQGYRQVLCGHYRIIYEIMNEQRIEVAYVRHCSRQLALRVI